MNARKTSLLDLLERYAIAMKLSERHGNEHGDMDHATDIWQRVKAIEQSYQAGKARKKSLQELIATLEAENAELLRKLAAYEAQPTLDIMQVKPGEWERLIAAPITSAHLDRLLKEVKNATLEVAAMVCDRFQARDVVRQPAECAGAIRAMKEQP